MPEEGFGCDARIRQINSTKHFSAVWYYGRFWLRVIAEGCAIHFNSKCLCNIGGGGFNVTGPFLICGLYDGWVCLLFNAHYSSSTASLPPPPPPAAAATLSAELNVWAMTLTSNFHYPLIGEYCVMHRLQRLYSFFGISASSPPHAPAAPDPLISYMLT